jgi:hypothetical protein
MKKERTQEERKGEKRVREREKWKIDVGERGSGLAFDACLRVRGRK